MSYNNHHQGGDRKQFNKQFQEAASFRKANNDTQYFWDLVSRNKNSNNNNRNKNLKQEEKILFGKKVETTGEKGFIDDNIPVERSGPRSEEVGVLQSFAELEGSVPSYVINNISLMRYERPTPIQKHSVPLGLAGLDLMCCAQTGSGKTFAFLLPVVAALDRIVAPAKVEGLSNVSLSTTIEDSSVIDGISSRVSIDQRGALPRCIILAPTRELASQIHMDARRLIFNSRLKAVCVYGGNDLRSQLTELSTGCDIIVATPGRLNDLVERGCVSLSEVGFLILDEADRMLDMGFEPQIRRIVQSYDMPRREDRQTFLFSATFPGEIQTLAREFLREYVWIGVGRVGSTVENIKQNIVCASANPNEKIKLLLTAIEATDGRTLVFVQKKLTASWLCNCLNNAYGISAEEIHGDRSQSQRENALRQFRDGYIRILVATDVAARGLDVPAVTHVIQFDMPLSVEDFDVYVHRIGRTGRAGMKGVATSFYVPGRETGEGNGKIAQSIMRLLQENKQEVPDWFANLDDLRGGNNSRFGGGGGGYRKPYAQNNSYGGGGYGGGAHKFGGRDVRSNQSNTLYAGGQQGGQSEYGNGQHQQQGAYGSYQQHQGGGQGYQQQSAGYSQQGGYSRGPVAQGGFGLQARYNDRSGYQQQGGYQQNGGYQQQQQYVGGQHDVYQGQQSYGQHQVHYGGGQGADYHMQQRPVGGVPHAHNPYEVQQGGYYDQYGGYVAAAPSASVDSLGDQFSGLAVGAGTAVQPSWAPHPAGARAAGGMVPPARGAAYGGAGVYGSADELDPYQQQGYYSGAAAGGGYRGATGYADGSTGADAYGNNFQLDYAAGAEHDQHAGADPGGLGADVGSA